MREQGWSSILITAHRKAGSPVNYSGLPLEVLKYIRKNPVNPKKSEIHGNPKNPGNLTIAQKSAEFLEFVLSYGGVRHSRLDL